MAKNKDGKLVCPYKQGKNYTFCSEAVEKMEKALLLKSYIKHI